MTKADQLGLLQRPVPRDLHDVGARDLVVPGLSLGIFEDPQASKPEHGQRKKGRKAAHQRIGGAERGAVDAHDPKLTDDAADRRALPCPERDVVGEEEQKDRVVAPEHVQELVDQRHEDDVEYERGQAVAKCCARKRRQVCRRGRRACLHRRTDCNHRRIGGLRGAFRLGRHGRRHCRCDVTRRRRILSPVRSDERKRRRSEAEDSEQRPGDEAQRRHHVGRRDDRKADGKRDHRLQPGLFLGGLATRDTHPDPPRRADFSHHASHDKRAEDEWHDDESYHRYREQPAHRTGEQQHQEADRERGQGLVGERCRTRANGTVEDEVEDEIHHEEDADDAPDPGETRHDGPSPEQPACDPGHEGGQPPTERGRTEDDGFSSRFEVGRRLEPAADEEGVSADCGTGGRDSSSPDHDEVPVDRRCAREAGGPQDNEHVTGGMARDVRVAENDGDIVGGFAGSQRVVLEDADGIAILGCCVRRQAGRHRQDQRDESDPYPVHGCTVLPKTT